MNGDCIGDDDVRDDRCDVGNTGDNDVIVHDRACAPLTLAVAATTRESSNGRRWGDGAEFMVWRLWLLGVVLDGCPRP